jgi:hypothetical protein
LNSYQDAPFASPKPTGKKLAPIKDHSTLVSSIPTISKIYLQHERHQQTVVDKLLMKATPLPGIKMSKQISIEQRTPQPGYWKKAGFQREIAFMAACLAQRSASKDHPDDGSPLQHQNSKLSALSGANLKSKLSTHKKAPGRNSKESLTVVERYVDDDTSDY